MDELTLKATAYDVDGEIAIITLDRPARMNAWTGRMHTEYRHCLAKADADPAVRVIVVTGRGRGFCVGGDAEALQGHARKGGYDPGTPAELARPGYGTAPEFDASFAYHFGLTKPVIAAMNGPAAGVGLALACFADLRFAAAGAKFTTAHGRLNLPAEYGLSWLLPRMIGLARANELLLSSRVFLAEEALALGLVNRVLPAESVLTEAVAYARELARTVAPESLRQTRWQIYRDLHRDVAASVTDSEALLETMMRQPDYAEGVAAFLDKRPPQWGRQD
ncbi:MAG: enoyl-CoA hydratase [Gammaproteobacteria bacterium]|nr:enoyl-CoA hydratase [Gammaproteobacteria bacterium]MBK79450.1 enoyl-CoA hydratase [Gammaproteobacteria bacterium]